jgi:hypothetical protein
VSIEQLQGGLTKLARAQADAAAGGQEQIAVFKALGVEYQNADGTLRSTDAVFADVAESFANMEEGAGKTTLAVKLFGRAGANLLPLLNSGRAGLAQMREEAEKLGIVISGQTAKAAEQFNDNITRLGAALDGVGIKVAEELLPAMNDLVSEIVAAANKIAVFFMLFFIINIVCNQ